VLFFQGICSIDGICWHSRLKSIGYDRTILHVGVNQNVVAHTDVLMSHIPKIFEPLAESYECF
jgi:hypothetical protein